MIENKLQNLISWELYILKRQKVGVKWCLPPLKLWNSLFYPHENLLKYIRLHPLNLRNPSFYPFQNTWRYRSSLELRFLYLLLFPLKAVADSFSGATEYVFYVNLFTKKLFRFWSPCLIPVFKDYMWVVYTHCKSIINIVLYNPGLGSRATAST